MTKKVSNSSIKAPEVLLASSNGLNSSRSKKIHVSKTAAVRAKETEEMLEKIRLTPIYDRYGRPHFEGTPTCTAVFSMFLAEPNYEKPQSINKTNL